MLAVTDKTEPLIQLARSASQAILAIYEEPDRWVTQIKSDQSPLTAADLAAHHCLLAGLPRILDVPVLSEESTPDQLAARHRWPVYWLVDPLDGTREFLARNGEFTLNIALVINHQAVIGLIHQPTTGATYLGVAAENPLHLTLGAQKWLPDTPAQSLAPQRLTDALALHKKLRVLVSHRHGVTATQGFLESLGAKLNYPIQPLSVGSALKFGYLAEGLADFYPRLAPTCEWDTAAGQALLRAVGGDIVNYLDRSPLNYNLKANLLNPHFLAYADASFNWPT